MPKWSKDAKEFSVSVHYSDKKGSQIRVPKPILDRLGKPDKITFLVKGNKIEIAGTK